MLDNSSLTIFSAISTDKAAKPISVLGKTKKLAELLVEEIYMNSDLKQCSVRFGNVFASRGSVIETFVHQIKNDIVLLIDWWEHAWALDYQSDKKKYLENQYQLKPRSNS